MFLRAESCWRTRGRVGARKMIFCCGNQRAKLAMTTAATWVLPRPVGRQTRVLLQMQVLTIYCW
jgi:hypothetical protein